MTEAQRLHMQRTIAFMDALHAYKGQLNGTAADRETIRLTELRERYARGRISLGAFEAEVEVVLRTADAL